MKCETVFIYALCEPGTRTVRYIGQTNNLKGRFRQHISGSKKKHTHLGCWLRSLGEQKPNLVVLSEVSARDRDAEETRFIQAARSLGIRLTNATDGGGGCYNPTPETRRKMSAAHIGVPLSPEHCASMSAVRMGVSTGPLSPERCAAISAATMGVPKGPRSPEHCAALSAALKGVPTGPLSLETRAAMSAVRRGVPWSPARRAAYEAGKLAKLASK